VSRRQVVQGVGGVGLALLAGCGRWPRQAPQPKVYRIGYLSAQTPNCRITNLTRAGIVAAQLS